MDAVITGGELLARQLKKENVDTVFTLIGNQVSPTIVYLAENGIKVIHTRTETGAVLMANGWAQASRRAGVAIISGGPGFANAVSAIIKSYYARTPLVVITGAIVPQQRDNGVLAECEQVSLIRPYTKWACTVYDPARIPEYVSRAIQFSSTGRKGPVVLEIPINILKQKTEMVHTFDCDLVSSDVSMAVPGKIDAFLNMLSKAKRPIIIAGDEVYYDHAEAELVEFVDLTRIPVYTTSRGRGCIADTHPLCMGPGRVLEAGPQLYAFRNADLVITVGLESDYQVENLKPPRFGEKQKLVAVNKEIFTVINGNCRPDLVISGRVDRVLGQICSRIRELSSQENPDFEDWLDELKENNRKFWDDLERESICRDTPFLHPLHGLKMIKKMIGQDALIVLDGSNAMFWGGLCFDCNYPGQLIYGPDGQFGPMGTGVAVAIGAKAANPQREVVLYTGDGSFGFNALEMDTAVRFNLPVMVFIHNDQTWGFCKTTQEILYGKTEAADLGMVRYDKMVEALGGVGGLATDLNTLEESITKAKESKLPSCINIMVDKYAYSPGVHSFNEALKLQK
ncbi:MAG: thiamine pyrophosphate-binding protein [Peptococcaceae bacterium]|jgi:acetolactate synthase-1/2/3 large subunit|nr:thiamine pyrophosphate-binding protein [Peptococcaceae bacterium]MDH7525021.1 thiamine pyrophosphate-binding protein [Peptococcaceae bacterium]